MSNPFALGVINLIKTNWCHWKFELGSTNEIRVVKWYCLVGELILFFIILKLIKQPPFTLYYCQFLIELLFYWIVIIIVVVIIIIDNINITNTISIIIDNSVFIGNIGFTFDIVIEDWLKYHFL